MNGFKKDDSNLLYVQVSDYVREKIYSKEWGVDDRIPSEHELMEMFDLSRGTVQKGLKILVDEGLLVQQRGRGTFVTQPVMARPSSSYLLSFAETMDAQGIPYENRVMECEIKPAGKVCAQHLEIEEGDDYLYLARVRVVSGHPVMLIESHLNIKACPGLDQTDFDHEGLFHAVERTSGQGIGMSEVTYSARTAGKKRGEWLDCEESSPILDLNQTVRLDDGTPCEWGSVWLPANRCVISSEMRRAL